MKCPSCGSATQKGDWICSFCDHILDPSVLDDSTLGDDLDPAREERTHVIAWGEHDQRSEMPEAVMLGDVSVAEQEFGVMHGAGSDERGQTSTFLYYTSASTTRVIHPEAVPRLADANATIPRTPYEDFILSCIDGARTVRDIQRTSGLAAQEVVVTLLTLLDKGAVEIETSAGAPGSAKLEDPAERPKRSRRVTPTPRRGSIAARPTSAATEALPKMKGPVPDDFDDLPSVSDFEEIVDELIEKERAPPRAPSRGESLSDVWAPTDEAIPVVEPKPLDEESAEEVTAAVPIPKPPPKPKAKRKKSRRKKSGKRARSASTQPPKKRARSIEAPSRSFVRADSSAPEIKEPIDSPPIPKRPPPLPDPSEVLPRTDTASQLADALDAMTPSPEREDGLSTARHPVARPKSRDRAPTEEPAERDERARRVSSENVLEVRPASIALKKAEPSDRAPTPQAIRPASRSRLTPRPEVEPVARPPSAKPLLLDPSFLTEVPPSGAAAVPEMPPQGDDDDAPVIAPLDPSDRANPPDDAALKEQRKRALAAALKRGPVQERDRRTGGTKQRKKPAPAPVEEVVEAAPTPTPRAPERAPVVIDNARMLKAQKLFDQALKDKAEGNLVSARMNMKLALTFDPSNELYQQAFEDLSKNPDAVIGGTPEGRSRARQLYDEATEAENHGNVDRAIELLEKALSESKQAPFYNRLGVILATKKGEYVRAQALIEQALELAPGNTLYEKNMSKVLSKAAAAEMRPDRGGDKKGGLLGFLGRRK